MRIETPRLALRRWTPDDVEALARIHADPAIVAWLGELTRDDAAITIGRYEHHWDVHGFGRFAVADRATGALVGRIGVMRQPDWTETPEQDEVGWVVAADRWGEGLATEAASAAIADAFGRVGLERILSWTLPHNLASRRVMEKCGLRLAGTACWKGREHVWYDQRRFARRGAPAYRPARRMGVPKSSFGLSSAPHSSHATWNAEGSRASQDGQRATSVVSHWGHVIGRSSSCSSK